MCPETRYIIEYENGVEVNRIPYEVSDEELFFEQLEHDNNDYHTEARDKFHHWATLTKKQKDMVLKALLRDYIVRGRLI